MYSCAHYNPNCPNPPAPDSCSQVAARTARPRRFPLVTPPLSRASPITQRTPPSRETPQHTPLLPHPLRLATPRDATSSLVAPRRRRRSTAEHGHRCLLSPRSMLQVINSSCYQCQWLLITKQNRYDEMQENRSNQYTIAPAIMERVETDAKNGSNTGYDHCLSYQHSR